jgi:tetratricopeptide (TPR) repeat protein
LKELAELSYNQMVKDYGKKSVKVAHSLCYLAQALIQLGSARESKELLEECLAIEEGHYGKGHVATAATLSELASASGKLGDVQRRKELLERSLSIKERHYGKGHISTAVTLNNLATVHSELGDVYKERELLEQSLAIKDQHFGKNHLQSSATLVNLAGVHSELGDARQAYTLLHHCLTIEERHFGPGHIETAITLNNLALACGETGDLHGMKERLEQSLAIKQAHFGVDHFESCLTLANLSMAWGVLGMTDLARNFSKRALVACGSREVSCSRSHAVVLFRTAAVHYALEDISVSEDLTSRGLRMLSKVLGPTASARVLALERTRTARIWLVADRTDVLKWLEISWATERLPTEGADEASPSHIKSVEAGASELPFGIIMEERVDVAIDEYLSQARRETRSRTRRTTSV